MRVTQKTHRHIKLQNHSFILLFLAIIGFIAALSARYNYEADWTASGRNSLTESSQKLLKQIEGPITILSFAQKPGVKQEITKLVNRYQRYKPDLKLEYVNPELSPEKVRELGVRFENELVVEKNNRQEKVEDLTEKSLTNALNKVARSNEEVEMIFIEGHGERDPNGSAKFALGNFSQQLESKGFHIQTLNLSVDPKIPNNPNQIIVIASPQTNFLPGEANLIKNYVKTGGHLLWLVEPGSPHGLDSLAKSLDIKMLSGTVIDPNAQLLFGSAALALISKYDNHPITEELSSVSIFPQAAALETLKSNTWQQQPILTTLPQAWVETSRLDRKVQYDEGKDILGPLTIGYVLTRELESSESKTDSIKEEKEEVETSTPALKFEKASPIPEGKIVEDEKASEADQELESTESSLKDDTVGETTSIQEDSQEIANATSNEEMQESIEATVTQNDSENLEQITEEDDIEENQDELDSSGTKESDQEVIRNGQQRIAVIGDGDFISNAYLGNGSNLDLALNLVNWLAHEDKLISVPARTRVDSTLEISPMTSWLMGLGFLFILPVMLLISGLLIWWRRRQY
ncbi:GldG family protein [Candidatus Nitrosacidococcus tergens]|uniref:Uncharacterized protein n=1 Tax=Candidatus Nitrosacidococcus tergens TaxID=553981 RepID=A0A7G1QC14_9GAMM|nr:DUF4350 domain-containing protein [Candidatus Nitrosacidococcus tergens]CAB1277098.1 conserved protein of unknown function [Candidatus Nitrosacidococcus tergens]